MQVCASSLGKCLVIVAQGYTFNQMIAYCTLFWQAYVKYIYIFISTTQEDVWILLNGVFYLFVPSSSCFSHKRLGGGGGGLQAICVICILYVTIQLTKAIHSLNFFNTSANIYNLYWRFGVLHVQVLQHISLTEIS